MKSGESKVKVYKAADDVSYLSEAIVAYSKMYVNPIALLTNSKQGLNAKAALDFIAVSGFTYEEFQEAFNTTVKTIQNYVVQDLKLGCGFK